MGLPSNLFTTSHTKYRDGGVPFPDLNSTWNKATYAAHEFKIEWSFYKGNNKGVCSEFVTVRRVKDNLARSAELSPTFICLGHTL
jgi:hypothetical protein